MYFEYGNKEIEYLKKKDKILGNAIDKIGHIYRDVDNDLFICVVKQIVGQQISSSALKTVWARIENTVGIINVENICNISDDKLQKCGLSFRKVGYIKNFAQKVKSKEFDIESLWNLSDDEVIKQLSSLNGIGEWTAEMIMLFCMQRKNILSYKDLGIQRGMRMLYHHRNIDRKKFEKYKKRYSPYGSVASLYLWEISANSIPDLTDYAPKSKK